MISFQEARKKIKSLAGIVPVQTSEVDLLNGLNRVIDSDIIAPIDMPLFDRSAMDGFAIGLPQKPTEQTFKIVGEVQAGEDASLTLQGGEAVRIYTGGVVPKGTYAVVPIEDVVALRDNDSVVIDLTQVMKGQHIRRRGEQFRKGDVVLEGGTLLNEAAIALLSSVGIKKVKVKEFPLALVLITGNEIATGKQEIGSGRIYDSNGILLNAYLKKWRIKNKILYVKDDTELMEESIKANMEQSGVIISTGGVSVGKYDHVPTVAKSLGFEVVFHKVRQKPGKPLFLAVHKQKRVVWWGLPGNPAAVWMGFNLYVLPFLLYNSGYVNEFPKTAFVESISSINNHSERDWLMAARLTNSGKVEIFPKQRSDMLMPLSHSDAIAHVPAETNIKPGDIVKTFIL
ncbi:MAG: molybdopterin molybdotransferase MoeA [Chlorobi bacterium]|nr:molybdopterin molybdotransferase MoeA [Chlorobiota bacterium]